MEGRSTLTHKLRASVAIWRSLIRSECLFPNRHLFAFHLFAIESQVWMRDDGICCLGECGLTVPANTAKPSSSFRRASVFASASVANVFVWRGLRIFGRMPIFRTSKVTYQSASLRPHLSFSHVGRWYCCGASASTELDFNQEVVGA